MHAKVIERKHRTQFEQLQTDVYYKQHPFISIILQKIPNTFERCLDPLNAFSAGGWKTKRLNKNILEQEGWVLFTLLLAYPFSFTLLHKSTCHPTNSICDPGLIYGVLTYPKGRIPIEILHFTKYQPWKIGVDSHLSCEQRERTNPGVAFVLRKQINTDEKNPVNWSKFVLK